MALIIPQIAAYKNCATIIMTEFMMITLYGEMGGADQRID
jgi:hypothetical protein